MVKVLNNIKYFIFGLEITTYKYFFINIFVTILVGLNTSVNLIIFKLIIDVIDKKENINMIFYYIIIYTVFLLVSSLLDIYRTSIYNPREKLFIQQNLQKIMLNKIRNLDISCFENSEFYNKYVRAMNEVDERFFQIFDTILQIVLGVVTSSSLIILLSTLNSVFVIFSLIMVITIIIRSFKINKIQYQLSRDSTKIQRERSYIKRIFYLEQYSKELKLFPIYEMLIKKYEDATDGLSNIIIKYNSKKATVDIINVILNISISLLLISFISLKILKGEISIGDFMIVFTSVTSLSKSLSGIMVIFPDLSLHSMYIDNLLELLNYRSAINESYVGTSIEGDNFKNIYFKNVNFSYNLDTSNSINIIKNITMNIEAGKKIAIVGRNGMGKTTFIKLLLRLYDPSSGVIEMNGNSYQEYNIHSLRAQFSVLFQDYNLYALTIAENILMSPVISKEAEFRVWEALKFSGLYDKVKKMENGINTVITKEFDDSGIYFSGGEKQLLSIARAYASKSSILIFDEPSSSLDVIFERKFFNRLMELGSDKTIIYVTHNLQATVKSDIIYYFENGSIEEVGTHDELIKLNGKYKVMFEVQQNKYN